jgi:hypothetical protein
MWNWDFSYWSVCPPDRTMGQMNAITTDGFVRATSWVWHFSKDVRQSKCEATSFEKRTDIKLPCVTGNIDTHRTTQVFQTTIPRQHAIRVVTFHVNAFWTFIQTNGTSPSEGDHTAEALCHRDAAYKTVGKHSSTELESAIPDPKRPYIFR